MAGIVESPGYQPLIVGNIFPNPVMNVAQVEIVAERTCRLKATLYSHAGKQVKIFAENSLHPGKQSLTFQPGELQSGVYYLVFADGVKEVVKKVVRY